MFLCLFLYYFEFWGGLKYDDDMIASTKMTKTPFMVKNEEETVI